MAIFKAVDKSSKSVGGSRGVLNYVGDKAEMTTGLNCSDNYKQAFKDFQEIKEFHDKLEDRQYKHFVHSFKPEETTQENALEMTEKLCKELFPEYQVFIGLHNDKEHIHNHIVVNSVNFENGEKFYYKEKEFFNWRDRADEIAVEYGLEIVQEKKVKENGEIVAQSRETREIIEKGLKGEKQSDLLNVAVAVISAGEKAKSKIEFENELKDKGISVNWGEEKKPDGTIKSKKYITLEIDEEHRCGKRSVFRLDNLGKKIHHTSFDTEKLREHFKELEKIKEIEQKREQERNYWKKQNDRGGIEI